MGGFVFDCIILKMREQSIRNTSKLLKHAAHYCYLTALSSQLHTEVEKPLLTFRGDNFKKDLKKYDHHIADLRKQLASRYASVEKVRGDAVADTHTKPAVKLHADDCLFGSER